MKIAFYEIKENDVNYFTERLKEHQLFFFKEPLKENNLVDAEIITLFVGSKITKNILEKFGNLKYICTRSTGYDHIDLRECKKRSILVSNVPGYSTEAIAEQTIALMLIVSRRLFESFERTRKGIFSSDGLTGFQLRGKTLGIIGTGRIGKRVAELAKAFGMKVIAYDIFPDFEKAKTIGYEYVDLEFLLSESNIITLHANLTEKNYHILDKKAFEKMKDNVVIINTARGELIDTEALIQHLNSGKVSAAAIDVLENEQEIRYGTKILEREIKENALRSALSNFVLFEMEDRLNGVVISPHNAFNTYEAIEENKKITLENILAFINGNPMNVVENENN